MKKLKKLVIGGIESKVLTLVLVSMLLVATVFILSMLTQNKLLTDLSNDTNERQVASVTGITSTVIDTVIVDNMNRITQMEAVETDEMFRDAAVRVQMISDYAGKLLSDPGSVPPAAWNRPDASHDGELFVKVLFAEGIDEEAVSDRIGVIANMSDMLVSLCSAYGTNNIWFTLNEGVTLMAGTVPGKHAQRPNKAFDLSLPRG